MCNRVNRDQKKEKAKRTQILLSCSYQLNITYPGMILYPKSFHENFFYRVGPKFFLGNCKIIQGVSLVLEVMVIIILQSEHRATKVNHLFIKDVSHYIRKQKIGIHINLVSIDTSIDTSIDVNWYINLAQESQYRYGIPLPSKASLFFQRGSTSLCTCECAFSPWMNWAASVCKSFTCTFYAHKELRVRS